MATQAASFRTKFLLGNFGERFALSLFPVGFEMTYAPPAWLQLAIWLPVTLFDFEVTRRKQLRVEAADHGA